MVDINLEPAVKLVSQVKEDVNIGPTTLANVAEALRKIRNSARFALANVRPSETSYIKLSTQCIQG